MNRLIKIVLVLLLVIGTAWGQLGLFGTRSPEDRFDRGIASFNDGRYAAARTIFIKLVDDGPEALIPVSMMMLMKSEYHTGDPDQAIQVGRTFLSKYSASSYSKDVYLCFGDIFIDQGKLDQALSMYMTSRRMSGNPDFVSNVDDRLIRLLPLALEIDRIRGVNIVESNLENRMILLLAEAYTTVMQGLPDEAAIILSQIDISELPGAYQDIYTTIQEATYTPARIALTAGVILPLTGPDSENARLFLAGLNSAVHELKEHGINLSLVIYDNLGDAVETSLAVLQCAGQANIDLIIGPLSDENSVVAAVTAQEEGLPIIIPTCMKNNLSEIGDFVFQSNATLSIRGKLAGRYVAGELGLDSLAVLASADEFGHALTDAFITEVDALGKTVVAVEWYTGIPQNLRQQFLNLREIAFSLQESDEYEEFLGMEIDSLESMFEISEDVFFDIPDDEEDKMTARDSARMVLETIQALYLPIHPGHIQYLGTQFPSFNLSTQLIGNENWLEPDILNQDIIGPHLEGMAVVANRILTADSVSTPALDISESGDLRYYYFGMDHGMVLSSLAGSDWSSRSKIKEELGSLDLFRGESQLFSFSNPNNNINAALQILDYRNEVFNALGYFQGDSLNRYEEVLP